MGEQLTIPWVGTSGPAAEGDYAAVVGLGGEQVRTEVHGARFIDEDRFEFADGTSVDIASVWAWLQPGP
jgi:hypothetical protein